MDNPTRKPIIMVFAGPNGSGKTTVTRRLPTHGTYINADDIKATYNLTDLEAAQKAEALRNALLNKRIDFSFETVLSTERNLLLLEKAKSLGYEIHCVYVLTCDANINVARVKMRHMDGGHNVPEDKIRARYQKALGLIPQLLNVCDNFLLFDNSDRVSMIFRKEGNITSTHPNKYWSDIAIQQLLGW